MTRTIAREQRGASQPYTWPASTSMAGVLQVYPSGTDFIFVEESDALQANLPAAVTNAPTVNTVLSGNLYDSVGRGIPAIASITNTPFTITRDMIGINVASDWRTVDLTKVGFLRLIDYPFTWKYIELVITGT